MCVCSFWFAGSQHALSPHSSPLCVFLVLCAPLCTSPPCVCVCVSREVQHFNWLGSRAVPRIKQIRRALFLLFFFFFEGVRVSALSRSLRGSLHRSLSSVVRRGVPVHVLSSWYLSPSGRHPLLLLPPVTKPNPHHLLLQLQAVR